MVGTQLHWVEGPWRGRLAMAARPRGGDWLADEIAEWKLGGVETVVSMLERSEEHELELSEEGSEVLAHGMNYRSFPMPDRDVPPSEASFHQLLMGLETELNEGRNLVLHCRQGIGRTGLVAAGLFIAQGLDPLEALQRLSAARGIPVPETPAQRRWIAHFAETLASAR